MVHFAFVLPVSVEPSAPTVTLGDTLWLSANFSDSLLDLRSNMRYRIRPQDLPLHSIIGFFTLNGAGTQPTGFTSGFRIVNEIGKVTDAGGTTKNFLMAHDGTHYRARIGIIPQAKGVFAFSIITGLRPPFRAFGPLPFMQVSPDAKGRPRSPFLDDIYYVINDGDTNFPLLQQNSYTSTSPSVPHPREATVYYEQKETFTFMVD